MSLPKFLLRAFKPLTFTLIVILVVISFRQYQNSQQLAKEQSQSNVKTASALVWSQIETTFAKVDLLQEQANTPIFSSLAHQTLANTYLYKSIAQYDQRTQSYVDTRGESLPFTTLESIQWNAFNALSHKYAISTLYQKSDGFWVFAIKQLNNQQKEIWFEVDVQHITQYLANLKTLKEGYVFVIDATTGQLIFHPNPTRIGTRSISYFGGLDEQIQNNQNRGSYEYFYNGQLKISEFDARNPMNWVFVSGTSRADILFTSYQIGLSALVVFALFLLLFSINYISYQLNQSLAKLNQAPDIAHFKHDLRAVFDRFTFHRGMQFCLYEQESGSFKTIDFHGNSKVIHQCETLPKILTLRELNYMYNSDYDELARKLQIHGRHYALPLYQRDSLIGIIYLRSSFFAFDGVIRAIRDFSEVALSNLLLFQRLNSKDTLTGLDNKLTMRNALSVQLHNPSCYFALIDINGLRSLNRNYGDMVGDTIILYIADIIKRSFPKPKSNCIGRYESGLFALLFNANDMSDARKQLDWLRQLIEKLPLNVHDEWIKATVSIGLTATGDSTDAVIGRATQSLQQAKLQGRNKVHVYQE
ncbi:diguanylate cyclase domain-containing protein [Vibrio mediterranei]|uniref:diguanylate cyclase domain-containing protein n=1 Tax=Vibrio mediterranei TaxID=689 RepID=UPI004068AEA1